MSLRISSPGKGGHVRRGGSGEPLEPDFYMSRLIKLLPAEAVAVYPMLHNNAADVVDQVRRSGGAPSTAATSVDPVTGVPVEAMSVVSSQASSGADWLPMAMAWFVLLLVILLRWQATRDSNGNAQWGAVAIAAISFFLWVPTMNGTFGIMEFATAAEWIDWPQPVKDFVPEILLIFWTIVIPAFYKPDN